METSVSRFPDLNITRYGRELWQDLRGPSVPNKVSAYATVRLSDCRFPNIATHQSDSIVSFRRAEVRQIWAKPHLQINHSDTRHSCDGNGLLSGRNDSLNY